jgi:hypothetical protein
MRLEGWRLCRDRRGVALLIVGRRGGGRRGEEREKERGRWASRWEAPGGLFAWLVVFGGWCWLATVAHDGADWVHKESLG